MMIDRLRTSVKKLLDEGTLDIVIGYSSNSRGKVTPIFVENESESERLVWNDECVFNLATFLPVTRNWGEIPGNKKIGIVAKGCDVKSICSLIQEKQVERDGIFIIGMECRCKRENGEVLSKCAACDAHKPQFYDLLIETDEPESAGIKTQAAEGIDELEGLPPGERLGFWKAQFEKCIRCYACRQVCPMCYCRQCITDSTSPRWIAPFTSGEGNFDWNIVRAWHLAGRCTGCGECERVCPVSIPIGRLNKKLRDIVKDLFGYEAGGDFIAKPPLDDFSPDDTDGFIK